MRRQSANADSNMPLFLHSPPMSENRAAIAISGYGRIIGEMPVA